MFRSPLVDDFNEAFVTGEVRRASPMRAVALSHDPFRSPLIELLYGDHSARHDGVHAGRFHAEFNVEAVDVRARVVPHRPRPTAVPLGDSMFEPDQVKMLKCASTTCALEPGDDEKCKAAKEGDCAVSCHGKWIDGECMRWLKCASGENCSLKGGAGGPAEVLPAWG